MDASDLALWRYSVIAPLLHVGPETSRKELARSLAMQPKLDLNGAAVTLSAQTVLRWYRRYRAQGVSGLEKRPRKDRGTKKALPEEAHEKLLWLAEAHPEWTVCTIHREAEKQLGGPVSRAAAYRLLAGHRRRARTEGKTPRRPIGVPQILWLADTMYGPCVYGPRRQRRKTYLIAFMDDASRVIMAGRFTTRDDVAGLIPILREAILARGCPSRLLCDNGANYRSRVVRAACAHLGIHLVYATPYHPQSKARLERFFLTVRLRLLPTLPAPLTLEALNEAWARFLAAYHAEPHSSLSEESGRPTSPLTYYLTHLPSDVRMVREVALDELLVVDETRRVQRDGTLSVAGRAFEVDLALAGGRVVVRFNPSDASRVAYRPFDKPSVPFVSAFPVQ